MREPSIVRGWILCLTLSIATTVLPSLAGDSPKEDLLLIRMSSAARAVAEAEPSAVARFVERHRPYLATVQSELLQDPVLAREVLGEIRIFEELEEFDRNHGVRVKAKFVDWNDAFRYLSDYVADPANMPAVAQLGDTWAGHFRSRQVIAYERPLYWGVRALWYWKHLIDPETVKTGEGFLAASRKLRQEPPPGLVAPLVIPTAPTWDLLHNLAVWLYNSGSPPLVSIQRKFGVLPWREAVLADEAGSKAVQFLTLLSREGLVALPEEDSPMAVEDFLDGKYAMIIVGPWIAGRAERKQGPGWEFRIAPAFPPSLTGKPATTATSGSSLVVLDPSRGRRREAVTQAEALVQFLTSAGSQIRRLDDSGDLPYSPEALSKVPHAEFFQAARERAISYPQIPEWGPVIENLVTRDNLYAFWKRLAALNKTEGLVSEAEQRNRERLVLAALQSAEDEINLNLSLGKWLALRPWLIVALALLCLATCFSAWSRSAERRKHQARIAESEAKYRDLYDNAPDMFYSAGFPMGLMLECNQTFLDKTGYSREEVLGREAVGFFRPDCRKKLQGALAALREDGRVDELELDLQTKHDGRLMVSLNASAVRDDNGNILKIRTVLRDITRRRALEEISERRRQELAHVTRVAAVGEFTASLAHELNQPLTAVVTNAQAAQRLALVDHPNLDGLRPILADIAAEGQRAADVIRALRNLLQKSERRTSDVDMNEIVREVIQLLRRQPPLKDVDVRLELNPGVPLILGDRTQLEQVILNLVLNAADSMQGLRPECRKLVVRTSCTGAEDIEVAVSDSGVGIDETAGERIFDAFFTTKPQGLGMGLPISRTIVEGHGGRLWAERNPQGGATFRFSVKS
jgi:PAS domain S-box-containing protein